MSIYSHLHFTVIHVEVYLMIWLVFLVFFLPWIFSQSPILRLHIFCGWSELCIFWVMAHSYYICLRTSFSIISTSTILHNKCLQNWLRDRIQERFLPIYLWIKWNFSHWWWNMFLSKQLSFIISKKQWKMNIWLRAKVLSHQIIWQILSMNYERVVKEKNICIEGSTIIWMCTQRFYI